jgi:hypothetical protein
MIASAVVSEFALWLYARLMTPQVLATLAKTRTIVTAHTLPTNSI